MSSDEAYDEVTYDDEGFNNPSAGGKMLLVGEYPQLGGTCANKTATFALVVKWQLELKYHVVQRHTNSVTKLSCGCAEKMCSFRINANQVELGPTFKFTKVIIKPTRLIPFDSIIKHNPNATLTLTLSFWLTQCDF